MDVQQFHNNLDSLRFLSSDVFQGTKIPAPGNEVGSTLRKPTGGFLTKIERNIPCNGVPLILS